MKKLILVLLLLLPAAVFAQSNRDVTFINTGPTLPATCSVGQVWNLTTGAVGVYGCSAANTWSSPGAGTTTGPAAPTNTDILTSDGTANHAQDPGGCTMTSTQMTCAAQKILMNGNTTATAVSWPSELFYSNATRDLRLQMSAADKFQWLNGPYNLDSATGVLGWTLGGADTGISKSAASVVAVGNGTAADTTGKIKASGYMSVGTKFTTNGGCGESAGTTTGGATAGKFTTAGTTSCTTVITLGDTATSPNGWDCHVVDLTTAIDFANPHQSASNATTVTIVSGTIVASDVLQFSCIGY